MLFVVAVQGFRGEVLLISRVQTGFSWLCQVFKGKGLRRSQDFMENHAKDRSWRK
jgi:hypothetical protein